MLQRLGYEIQRLVPLKLKRHKNFNQKTKKEELEEVSKEVVG
jgi:hypothetical protein